MPKHRSRFAFSPVSLSLGLTGTLLVLYIGLIATVMSYAALTIEFSQSIKTDNAAVATLESSYLSTVSRVTSTDYTAAGYTTPATIVYVPAAPATALR